MHGIHRVLDKLKMGKKRIWMRMMNETRRYDGQRQDWGGKRLITLDWVAVVGLLATYC